MLRTRLFLSLLPFVILLLAVGSYAIVLFSRLAHTVDTTVAENYRSLLAVQEMSLALGGLESEAWAATGWPNPVRKDFAEHKKRFADNLTLQLKCESLPGEKELNDQLLARFNAFQIAIGQLSASTNTAARRQVYDRAIVPGILQIRMLLGKIRDTNQRAVFATSDNIQDIMRHITRLMVLGMVVALVVSAYAYYKLSRAILAPISSLTRASQALGEGNWDQPVPVISKDELGELALAFNKMAAQLQEYRQSTSEEIVRLHRTMETTLASFPDPIFVLGRDRCIELQNVSAQALASGLGLRNQLPDRLDAIAQATLATGKDFLPHTFDAVVSYRVGEADKFFLPRVLAMKDKKGAPLGVAVVLYDVTRFRLLDAAKSNLVATVSHELKTPLTSVRMALHILAEKNVGLLTPKQDELVTTAREDAERLLHILNDLLDLARLDEGRAELRREEVAPIELLQGVKRELTEAIAAKGLQVSCQATPDLPAVFVDRQRIRHVFRNLIHNAIKHSPDGGQLQLRATSANGEGVQFTVTDQGQGVPEEFQARIFDRFFRVPGQSKTGAGLGLSIAREITVAHGGRIGVKSQPGQGSTFYVILKTAQPRA